MYGYDQAGKFLKYGVMPSHSSFFQKFFPIWLFALTGFPYVLINSDFFAFLGDSYSKTEPFYVSQGRIEKTAFIEP